MEVEQQLIKWLRFRSSMKPFFNLIVLWLGICLHQYAYACVYHEQNKSLVFGSSIQEFVDVYQQKVNCLAQMKTNDVLTEMPSGVEYTHRHWKTYITCILFNLNRRSSILDMVLGCQCSSTRIERMMSERKGRLKKCRFDVQWTTNFVYVSDSFVYILKIKLRVMACHLNGLEIFIE